jgi:hypothetical protein
LRGDQAGWRCDACRRNGLEKKRRCGWLPEGERGPEVVVWARGGVTVKECPKTVITGESGALVEKFVAWRLGGGGIRESMAAREAEAFQLLSIESEKEKRNE